MDNESRKINVNWRNVIFGSAIGLILLLIFPTIAGSMIAIFLATIYVGFAVRGNYKNGAFNGAIVGILVAIIQGLIYYSNNSLDLGTLAIILLAMAITYGIIGIVGGIIGIRIDKW